MTDNVSDFAPEAGENKTMMLSDVIRVLKRYSWLMLTLSLGLAIIVFIWSKRQPKQYDATAMLQIDQHASLSLGSVTVSDEYELKIATQVLALQSHDVAMAVISHMNLQNNRLFNPDAPKYTNLDDPATRNHLVKLFVGNLDIERVPKTELISVTYRSLSPTLSALVANQLVESYLEQNFQHRYAGSKLISGWLTRELDDLKNRVQKEQAELLSLEAKTGIMSTSPTTDSSVYETELQELLSESIKAQTQTFAAQAQYLELSNDTSGVIPASTVPGTGAISALSVQIAQLEAQEQGLATHYGPGYGPLKQLKDQIASLKVDLAENRKKSLEGAHEQAMAAEKTEADIAAKIAAVKLEALGMNSDTVHYKVLKSQYMADQTLYNGLLGLLSAGGIEAGLKIQEVNPMSSAEIPSLPAAPRVMLNTIAAFAIGFLLAITTMVVKVAISDTVETVEQVEESLNLPVLGTVPVYKLDAPDPASKVMPLISLTTPKSPGAEAYRILRTSLGLIPGGKHTRVIGITSCGPGEGKSTTIMNLAVVFTQQSKRVLMIDADMRKPNLSNWMKMGSMDAPALSQFLSDPTVRPEDCTQTIPSLPGLHVIPVGAIPPFPSELLAQGRLDDLIAWARLNFDIVLIDTPPALLVTDALIVAQSLDILLVVARVGSAQRRALRRLQKDLARFPGKHLGTVVNAVPVSQSYYSGYSGKYGYGYFKKGGD